MYKNVQKSAYIRENKKRIKTTNMKGLTKTAEIFHKGEIITLKALQHKAFGIAIMVKTSSKKGTYVRADKKELFPEVFNEINNWNVQINLIDYVSIKTIHIEIL